MKAILTVLVAYLLTACTTIAGSWIIANAIKESSYSAFGDKSALLGSFLSFTDYFVYGGTVFGRRLEFFIFFAISCPIYSQCLLSLKSNYHIHRISDRCVILTVMASVWLLSGLCVYWLQL